MESSLTLGPVQCHFRWGYGEFIDLRRPVHAVIYHFSLGYGQLIELGWQDMHAWRFHLNSGCGELASGCEEFRIANYRAVYILEHLGMSVGSAIEGCEQNMVFLGVYKIEFSCYTFNNCYWYCCLAKCTFKVFSSYRYHFSGEHWSYMISVVFRGRVPPYN